MSQHILLIKDDLYDAAAIPRTLPSSNNASYGVERVTQWIEHRRDSFQRASLFGWHCSGIDQFVPR